MKKIALLSICLFFSVTCFGQQRINKDTVYYLLDTIKISPKDRLVSLTSSNGINTTLEIDCPCLLDGSKPRFVSNRTWAIPISIEKMKATKFISLASLIDLARKNDYWSFYYKYVLYVVEPAGNKYAMYKTIVPRKGHISEDWIIQKK